LVLDFRFVYSLKRQKKKKKQKKNPVLGATKFRETFHVGNVQNCYGSQEKGGAVPSTFL